jgi:hypothetical protein
VPHLSERASALRFYCYALLLFYSKCCPAFAGHPRLAQAQTGGVRIGTASAPNASAALDVSSTRGLLPRLSTAQRDAIVSPAAGLTIFNTSTNRLNTWNGRSWDQALSATETLIGASPQTFSVPGQ